MKCKHCDGTGNIERLEAFSVADIVMHEKCKNCNGTGEITPTNEEWRKTCSTKEFAEWISNLAYACMRCGMSNGEAYCHTGYCIQDEADAEKWLKEKHEE